MCHLFEAPQRKVFEVSVPLHVSKHCFDVGCAPFAQFYPLVTESLFSFLIARVFLEADVESAGNLVKIAGDLLKHALQG